MSLVLVSICDPCDSYEYENIQQKLTNEEKSAQSTPSTDEPNAMPLSSLRRLRRYQEILLIGGGMIVTFVTILTFVLAAMSAMRRFLIDERQRFFDDRAVVTTVVRESEASMRRTVAMAALTWNQGTESDTATYERFRQNGNKLILDRPTLSRPVLLAMEQGQEQDPALTRRYLALAQQLALISTAASVSRDLDLDRYAYSVDEKVITMVPASRRVAAQSVKALIAALRVPVADMAQPSPGARGLAQPVTWLPPFTDPLTGHRSIRLVSIGRSNSEPFAVFVTEYEPNTLLVSLPPRSAGALILATPDGQIVAGTEDDEEDRRLAQTTMRHRVPTPGIFGGEVGYLGGMFVFSTPLANTGWMLISTFSWPDVISGIATQIGTGAAATAVILSVIWILLFLFRRRVIAPLIADSERVFESENLSRTMIQTVPVGLALVPVDGGQWLLQSSRLNEMASRIVGSNTVLARELIRLYGEFEHGGQDSASDVRTKDLSFPSHDGAQVELAVSASRVRYKRTDILVAAFVDVTENRQLERKLAQAMRAANTANQAKSAFLAAMSHEIRTPLNAILGNLELLADSPLTERQRDRLATVREASDGLLAVISDILDFSKIEAGEMPLENIVFDVVEVAERALGIFAPVARTRGLELYARFDSAASQTMYGDPTRLGQILNNLLSNAIKFTQEGKVTLTVSIRGQGEAAEWLDFTVEDTGIGMSGEQQTRLFKAFSQLDVSINRRFGGTGLGLALCQRLLHAMGGSIDVQSQPGAGSRFSVRLPAGDDIRLVHDVPLPVQANVLLLSAAREWREFAEGHLQAWCSGVKVFQHPALIADHEFDEDVLLVIWGGREQWTAEDENRLVENARWVIDGYPDGPAHILCTGRIVTVSCLSLKGLEAALRTTVLGEHKAVEPVAHARYVSPGELTANRALHVLVAEDNVANRELLCEQISTLGCHAHAASNGREAIGMLDDQEWDVVLTDINMPGMSGYELAAKIRELRPSLPVVAVTAHATVEERARCAAAGMYQALTKPLSIRRLHELLQLIANERGFRVSDAAEQPSATLAGAAIPKRLKETFMRSVADALAAIRQAQSQHDRQRLIEEVHSVRGALAVFGHPQLATLCAQLEQALRDSTQEMTQELRELTDALARLLEQ